MQAIGQQIPNSVKAPILDGDPIRGCCQCGRRHAAEEARTRQRGLVAGAENKAIVRLLRGGYQPIADAPDREQMARVAGIIFNVAS